MRPLYVCLLIAFVSVELRAYGESIHATGVLLAKRDNKKRSSRKSVSKGKGKRSSPDKGRAKGLGLVIQGDFGIVQGKVSELKETIFVYGGDVSYSLAKNFSIDLGFLLIDHYETVAFDAGFIAVDLDVYLSAMDLNAGGTYHYWLNQMFSLDLGMRLDQLSSTIEIDDDTGLASQFFPSQENSALIATILLGATARIGMFTVGAQLRQPIYSSDSEASEDFDARFLLATAGVAL